MFGLFAMHVSGAWSCCVAIHSCVAIPHCVGICSCVSSSVKREAVIAGLASEGLALLLGSAEAGSRAAYAYGSSGVPKVCARFEGVERSKRVHNEERGGGRDPGVRRPGVGRGRSQHARRSFVPH